MRRWRVRHRSSCCLKHGESWRGRWTSAPRCAHINVAHTVEIIVRSGRKCGVDVARKVFWYCSSGRWLARRWGRRLLRMRRRLELLLLALLLRW